MEGKGPATNEARPTRPPSRRGRRVLLVLLGPAVVVGILEVLARTVPLASLRRAEGALPYWLVNEPFLFRQLLDVRKHRGVWATQLEAYTADDDLFWRLRPGVDRMGTDFSEPRSLWDRTRWRLWTNEAGFRTQPLSGWQEDGAPDETSPGSAPAGETSPATAPLARSTRLLALGDSTAFGWGVEAEEAFPHRACEVWREAGRETRWGPLDARDLAVPGYSSEQGIVLARRWLPRLHPDVVTITFGSNDGGRAPVSDTERLASRRRLIGRIEVFLEKLRLAQILRHLLAPVRASGEGPRGGAALVPRVSLERFRANLRELDRLCREQGAAAVLVFTCGEAAYRDAARAQAQALGIPFVDAPAIFDRAIARAARDPSSEEAALAASVRALYEGVETLSPRWHPFVSPDLCHPNPEGHLLIARELADRVAAIVASRRGR